MGNCWEYVKKIEEEEKKRGRRGVDTLLFSSNFLSQLVLRPDPTPPRIGLRDPP